MFGTLKFFLFSIFFLTFFSFLGIVQAQSIPGVSEPITLESFPQFPAPDDTVEVTVSSFNTDLDRANISWTVNGKSVQKGTGVAAIKVPAGKAGNLTTVTVTVETKDIGSLTADLSWRPADVVLLWKTDGYVPPFYKGKAVELYGSSFEVSALPEFYSTNGTRLDPKTLLYTWKKNGTVDPGQSGYGKMTFSGSQTSYVRGGDDISVEVKDQSGTMGASKRVTLSPKTADVVLYENDPIQGILYGKSISGNLNLESEEISIHAEPYYVSSKNARQGLSYRWQINNANAPSFDNKQDVTLRKSNQIGAQATINLLVEHAVKILQGGNASIVIYQ